MYGYIYYNNSIGSFIHGFKAASYYGGVQSWTYYLMHSWRIFSIVGLLFSLSLVYLIIKKEFLKREVYLLLIWFVFFAFMVSIMPHKEDRYILLAIPPMCLLSGFLINKMGKYKNILFGIFLIILVFSLWDAYKLQATITDDKANICFKEGNTFLASDIVAKDAIIMTNQSPIVHYYTDKKIILYPESLSITSIKEIINYKYQNKSVYIYFANYDMSMESDFKKDLDLNFEKVFECKKGEGYAAVYGYK